MAENFNELTPQQQAVMMRNAALAMKAAGLRTMDESTGAPASVRAAVGSAQTPEDRLATIRKFYPDAEPLDADNFVYTDPNTRRPMLYNPRGMDIGDAASVLPEIAEVGGGAAGAAIAAGPALATAVPSGGTSLLTIPAAYGLGAAAGRELQTGIASNLGSTVDTRDIGTRLTDAAVTTGANAVGFRVGELAEQGIRRLTGPTVRATRNAIAPRANQTAVDFANAGIEPRAGAVSGSAMIQMMEHGLASTPGGAGPIREKAAKELAGIAEEADNLAGAFGPVKTPQEAGETIRAGSRSAAERFKARQDELYGAAYDAVGAGTVVDPAPIKALGDELMAAVAKAPETRGRTLGRALDRVNGILNDAKNTGGIDFGTLRAIRTDLGRELEDPVLAGATSAQKAAERRLYGVLTDVMNETAAKAPGGQKAIATADRYTRFNMTRNMDILQKIEDLRFDEQVLAYAMRGADKGGSNLASIRRNLQPQEWDVVAGSVLGRLGRARPGQQGATELGETAGDFSASTFLTNWNRLSPEARTALWGGTRYKALVPRLNALARLVDASKDADKLANTSGTARALLTALGLGSAGTAFMMPGVNVGDGGQVSEASLGDRVGNAAMATAGAVGGLVVAPRVAAKLITSPAFISWLETGVRLGSKGTGGMTSWLARLGTIAEANPEIREDIQAYRDALRPQ